MTGRLTLSPWQFAVLSPRKQVEHPVLPSHTKVDGGVCAQSQSWRKWSSPCSRGLPHHPAKRGPSCLYSFLCSLDHKAGEGYFYNVLLKPLHQRVSYLVSPPAILAVNFVLSPFHRCRNWEVRIRVTYKSHSWWEAKSGFQCIFVWLQGLCSLLCKRIQPH